MFFLGDTAFYWSHRFMHIPKIYKFCHKFHHTHLSPISWTSLYVHPGEFLIALLGIFILPVKLANANQNIASLYWSLIMLSLVSSHSGMKIPSFLSAEHHDEHHRNPKKNFGSDIGVWDYICGT